MVENRGQGRSPPYYHGILIDVAFRDRAFIHRYPAFASKCDGDWTIVGVEVPIDALNDALNEIQSSLRTDAPYYVHFYNDEQLIVVFAEKRIVVTPHASSWTPVVMHGRSLGIPVEQLDLWPNRFQDERHYFMKP